MADFILEKIRSVPRHATIAVVMPTTDGAKRWFDLLEGDLTAHHRPVLMSRRDDLTRRLTVHFTEVRETKGLEFDVVVVPDLGEFTLDTLVGRNQVYVAISRAKHALVLGCDSRFVARAEIKNLEQNQFVLVRSLPSH